MWRNFIKTFERSMLLPSLRFNAIPSDSICNGLIKNVARNLTKRTLGSNAILRNTYTARAETDTEYIVPYRAEHEKRASLETLVDALRSRFRLSTEDVKHILEDENVSKSCKMKSILATLDLLASEGVTKKSFVEYPWLLTLNEKRTLEKIQLLKSINGVRDFNDFVPFLRVAQSRLNKVVAALNQDLNHITHDNRVYYIAEKLNVPASFVTKYLAKRLFVLEMPLDMFKTNLKHMMNYKVEPKSLLKDLWAFRYTPRSVEMRLRRAQQAKKDKIMPWMVRCPESILQKSLQLSLDEMKVLDNKSSVAEYIGERLGFSPEDAQAIMNRHPQVNTVRVTKIKEVLDYLLLEEKFSRHEIAQVPRILCHSLKTTRHRIEELKRYNCRPSSLVIVCRSQREYEKFLNPWRERFNKYKSPEASEAAKNTIKEEKT